MIDRKIGRRESGTNVSFGCYPQGSDQSVMEPESSGIPGISKEDYNEIVHSKSNLSPEEVERIKEEEIHLSFPSGR